MNLKELNVEELPKEEISKIDGGWLIPLIIGYVIIEWACNPVSTAKAFAAGYNDGIK